MFLGILIGMAYWGILTYNAHDASPMSSEKKRVLEDIHPHVLSSVRITGVIRIISHLAALIGFCGAVGWILEVAYSFAVARG